MELQKIPTIEFPSIAEYNIKGKDERIISLKDVGLECDSQYYLQGVPGAYKDCYAREEVARRLLMAQKNLPDGYRLKIYDAYRPMCIQQRLWNHYRCIVFNNNPKLSDEEIDYKTSFFVSKPSYDVEKPSLHNTGGAVDLTIIGPDNKELDMGTKFDDFTELAWTNHYEVYKDDKTIRSNRRILYWAMIDAGFTNLPSEWWHYDYGTKFWAYFNNTDALYRGVIDIEFTERFPLI